MQWSGQAQVPSILGGLFHHNHMAPPAGLRGRHVRTTPAAAEPAVPERWHVHRGPAKPHMPVLGPLHCPVPAPGQQLPAWAATPATTRHGEPTLRALLPRPLPRQVQRVASTSWTTASGWRGLLPSPPQARETCELPGCRERPATRSAACSATTTRAAGTAATAPQLRLNSRQNCTQPCSAGSTSATVAATASATRRLPLRRLRLPARRRPVQRGPRGRRSVSMMSHGLVGAGEGAARHSAGAEQVGGRTLGFVGRAAHSRVLTEASGWTGGSGGVASGPLGAEGARAAAVPPAPGTSQPLTYL